ncbi:hypothetical protein ACFL27_09350 [candidate division CSSED10-310 bacterium]|uniref:DUF63 family protein n=1 Tax=candidate division CSSED10-310 bacterium TaxID=2855610 RepID=A0ABV6YW23_UNCC1
MEAWSPAMQTTSIWIAAFLTLCIYSFLYKDNPFYKFAEYLVVGVSAGYFAVIFYFNYIKPNLVDHFFDPTYPNRWILIIPTALGFMLLARIIPKYAWLSKYSMAIYLGAGAGLAVPRDMDARILKQVYYTFVNLYPLTAAGSIDWLLLLQNFLLAAGVVTTLVYFFFSLEHKGVVGKTARVGIIFIMISFGATFGYTVMGRISLLIGRVTFLLKDWLHLID